MVGHAVAGPGAISKSPLYAGSSVTPNILFLIDDSGSMFYQVALRDVAKDTSAAGYQGLNDYGLGGQWYNFELDYRVDASSKERYKLCHGINALGFNPDEPGGYTPWEGMPNATYPVAWQRPPYSAWENLSQHKFMPWSEADDKSVWEECGPLVTVADWAGADTVKQQSYANWYIYHRDRSLLFKRVLSEVFENLHTRAAYATINANSDDGWGMEMQNINTKDLDDPDFAARQLAKAELLNALYNTNNNWDMASTPLRMALQNAGLYYASGHLDSVVPRTIQNNFVSTGTPADPLLPEDEGGACQQNYTILATDGYTNDNGVGINYGDVDSDGQGNTLGDIARYYFETDLRTDFADLTHRVSNDVYDDSLVQHMVTHTLSFGVNGTLGAFPDRASTDTPWPTDINFSGGNDPKTLDDLMHASFNTSGQYLSATDLPSLRKSMNELVGLINNAAAGTGAAVGFNSTSIASGAWLFQGWFSSMDWRGELYAFDYSAGTRGAQIWQASTQMQAKIDAGVERKIVSYNGTSGVPFRAPSDITNLGADELNAFQIADLIENAPVGAEQVYAAELVNYLRGDGVYDASKFRTRGSLLGDIVHSSPQFVGAPNAGYPNYIEGSTGAMPYASFISAKGTRTNIVYVGANDGMLHAFNASTGDELFAYIPQAVFSAEANEGLHYLADTGYTHQPFVDASPTSGDVYIDGAWRTYLVGGLGAGGKSLYVLDVTDPALLADETTLSTIVKPEFSETHLGYTFSRPQIAKMNDGEWVAVFGNGYNNDTDGEAYLYVLYLDGAGGPSSQRYQKIGPLGGNLGTIVDGTCDDPSSDCNGLSSPTLLDLNGDGKLDRVYAGDIQGNMWAFDFTKTDVSTSHTVPVVAHKNGTNGVPMFSACRETVTVVGYCAATDRQPITAKPLVVAHQSERAAATEPNLLVLFGTGQYLSSNDKTDTDVQSFYGVWDSGPSRGLLRPSDLVEQVITDVTGDALGKRTLSSNAVNYSKGTGVSGSGVFGWYMKLEDAGERVVVTPSIAGDLITFVTTIPIAQACSGDGSGHLMAADLFSGGMVPFDVFPDVAPGAAGFDINALPGGMVILDNDVVISDSKGDVQDYGISMEKERPSRRSSWTIRR